MSQAEKVKVSAEEQTPTRALASIHNFSVTHFDFPPLSRDFMHCIHIIDPLAECWLRQACMMCAAHHPHDSVP